MPCPRHPRAAAHRGHCAACLLEEAFASEAATSPIAEPFTLHLPLGESDVKSVFLVRSDRRRGLMRLKVWRTQAPAGFLERFRQLYAQLGTWAERSIVLPLEAGIDGEGRPWVLTEFRQGVTLLDRVRSGRLAPAVARVLLDRLRKATEAAHRRGLIHGSVVPGNILVEASGTSTGLLDFGLGPLLLDSHDGPAPSAATDQAGFLSLDRTLLELTDGR